MYSLANYYFTTNTGPGGDLRHNQPSVLVPGSPDGHRTQEDCGSLSSKLGPALSGGKNVRISGIGI